MPKVTPAHEQQRREQILGAARACFARQGYHATSMDDVVRESGLSVGAIYTYFSSKEDLLLALAEERATRTLDDINAIFRRPGPMAERAQRAVDYFFDLLQDEFVAAARMNVEFWSEAVKSERLRARQHDRCEAVRGFYDWMLRSGRDSGDLRPDLDVEATAELFMALNEGLVMLFVAGMGRVPRERLKAAYTAFVNGGLGSPAEPFLPGERPAPAPAAACADPAAPLAAAFSAS